MFSATEGVEVVGIVDETDIHAQLVIASAAVDIPTLLPGRNLPKRMFEQVGRRHHRFVQSFQTLIVLHVRVIKVNIIIHVVGAIIYIELFDYFTSSTALARVSAT